MKKISPLPSEASRSKINTESKEEVCLNRFLKIPSNASATFATDQETYPEHDCVSYIYDSSNTKSTLTKTEIKKWRSLAIILTVFVTLSSLLFSVLFFVLSSETDSSSTIAVGMDSFFALLGAVFVLWRLFCPDYEHRKIVCREKAGSLFFGAAFIITGVITFGIATYRLFISLHSQKPLSVVITLVISVTILGILAFALHNVARKLNSTILMALALDTFFACVLSLGVFSAELIYMETMPKFWYLDDVVSIVISFFFALCGINLISKMVKSAKKRQSSETNER